MLSAARTGDREAAARVLEVFRPYLVVRSYAKIDRRVQTKVAPSDAAQETLIRAMNGFSRFSGDTAGSLLRWLDTIHGRYLVDVHRRFLAKKRNVRDERSLSEAKSRRLAVSLSRVRSKGPSPSEAFASRVDAETLRLAIDRLPERQREALELRFLQGLSSPQIAQRLGITASGARRACIRGLETLGSILDGRE